MGFKVVDVNYDCPPENIMGNGKECLKRNMALRKAKKKASYCKYFRKRLPVPGNRLLSTSPCNF